MILFYILLYIFIMFLNFLYFNRKDYIKIDRTGGGFGDILMIIFFNLLFLLFNITKYGIMSSKEKVYGGKFQWGDYVETKEGIEGIYYGDGYIYVRGSEYTKNIGDGRLTRKINGELKEELKMYAEAEDLKRRADVLISKKKKTIFN